MGQFSNSFPKTFQLFLSFPTSETPQKILRRCLARSQNLGHSQKKTNNRVATAKKLSVACPKPPSEVRALGAGDLCAPQNKPHINNNNATGRVQTSMLYAAQP